jgi:hypothetical protein
MPTTRKLLLIDAAVKVLIAGIVTVWLVLIYKIATSGVPMLRQLLGCMFTTMILFGLMSVAVKRLKEYRASLSE